MLMRLIRMALVIGLIAWAAECLNLSQSASAFVQDQVTYWLDR